MNIHSKKLWAGTLAAGVTATLGLTIIASSAPAESQQQRGGAVIEMTFDGGPPLFTGDTSEVVAGQTLTIVNNTRPRQIGPHLFSLIKPRALPETRKEIKACLRLESFVCKRIFKAHKVNPETFEVKKDTVEEGENGWDAQFGNIVDGDSWYTEKKGDTHSRTVVADAGTRLGYICIVHPDTMQGVLDVAPSR